MPKTFDPRLCVNKAGRGHHRRKSFSPRPIKSPTQPPACFKLGRFVFGWKFNPIKAISSNSTGYR
jgi:hypothetical protein